MSQGPGKTDVFYRTLPFNQAFKKLRKVIFVLRVNLIGLASQFLEAFSRLHQNDLSGICSCFSELLLIQLAQCLSCIEKHKKM